MSQRFIFIDDLPYSKVNISDFDKSKFDCSYQLNTAKHEIERYFKFDMKCSDILLLDNDLGYDIEGYQYLKNYISNANFPKIVIVTIRNPIAKQNMVSLLLQYNYKETKINHNEFKMFINQ